MRELALAIELMDMAVAAANAAARARAIYNKFKEQAERDKELTPEQSEYLDRRMEALLASPAQQQSGR